MAAREFYRHSQVGTSRGAIQAVRRLLRFVALRKPPEDAPAPLARVADALQLTRAAEKSGLEA